VYELLGRSYNTNTDSVNLGRVVNNKVMNNSKNSKQQWNSKPIYMQMKRAAHINQPDY